MKTLKRLDMHGELQFAEVEEIPESAVKQAMKDDFKLADSETTGNHHMLKASPGIELFLDREQDYYLKTSSEALVYCKLENRHTDLKLPAGKTFKITPAQEMDHLTRNLRNVLD